MRASSRCLRFGVFQLDPAERLLLRNKRQIPLAPKLFETLLFLVQNAGHLVKKEALMRSVWKDTFVEEGSLTHSISVLRKILNGRSAKDRYIETVPRHGYRFIARVQILKTLSSHQPLQAPPALHSLAVLPLGNVSRNKNQDYFADGMTEALITELAQIVPLPVISRTSVLRYAKSRKPLTQIAEELNVDGIVEGTVFRFGKRLRITAQLLHAPTDRHLWASSYERDFRDVLNLQREVAEAIAREIGGQLTIPRRRLRNVAPRHSAEAHEAYLKGRHWWNQRTEQGLSKSIEFYGEALSKDSSYALAYAGLADSYALLGSRRLGGISPSEAMLKARESAKKALSLDETLAESHLSLAFVRFQFDWDWGGAEKEFRWAIDLNPNSAASHYRYAMYLATMSRTSEAASEMKRALELDPLSPIIFTAQGRLLHFERRYDDAIECHRKALAIDPNLVEAHFNLGMVYAQKLMFRAAISHFGKASRSGSLVRPRASYWSAGLGYAYGLAGMTRPARRILNQLLRLTSPVSPVSPFDVAWVYLGLGEKQAALTWLEKAFTEHCTPLVYLNIEPALDLLRSEPRFQNLLRRMGLSQVTLV
jgi:TolB-like protein/Tfp pilus assembly protein PilF